MPLVAARMRLEEMQKRLENEGRGLGVERSGAAEKMEWRQRLLELFSCLPGECLLQGKRHGLMEIAN